MAERRDLLLYHGTGAFNITKFRGWDDYLLGMMDRPVEVMVVQTKNRKQPEGGNGRGQRKNKNPFLKDQSREYSIDINPSSLANRILSVREQIGREFVDDLDIVIKTGDVIIESYYGNVMTERDNEEYADRERPYLSEDKNIDNVGENNNDFGQSPKPPSRASFDRNGMFYLNQQTAFDEGLSSPLRKANFDLLVLLSTQEAIHRVLRNFQAEGSKASVSFNWLRDFYVERITSFFDGNQKYGRADDFLEELILTPPSVKKGCGKMSIIDPLGLVEKIVRMRTSVATEWKEILSSVPEDHIALRKKLFTQQMAKSMAAVEEEQQTAFLEEYEIGEFQ
eukprot:CAMPEP_0195508350 /NCGR_PEP_ID=MMETSP0794_2-20130614/1580_1 /TAXON_ID=515487 /ORGANISM="Stephanopyxis turris, Strain CCMP 815" /LENGTH=336 /DNA_ID=CAMNT_0040635285 /DNA_START=369 /DNA_END=1378 /DNA_ORIENTATION=+